MNELPEGWSLVPLSAVTMRVANVSPEAHPEREFEYVDISSIDNIRFTLTETKKLRGKDAPSRAKRPIQPKDTVFSNVRTYLRNVALVPTDSTATICSTGFTVLRPTGGIEPRYLFRYVLTEDFIDRVTPHQTGTHYPATSDRAVLAESICLAPLPEQRRIVEKVEALLAKVRSSQDRLDKIPNILRRFRQAVLAAACEGRLTADWRAERGLDVQSWRNVTINDILSEPLANGRSVPDADKGFPVLRLTCLKNGGIDLSERKIGAWSREEAKRFRVTKGDFLVARGNGSLSLVGRGGLIEVEPDAVAYPDTLIRIRLNRKEAVPRYFATLWAARPIRDQVEATARTTAGIWKISQRDIEGFTLTLPGVDEQEEIARRVDKMLAVADRIEQRYKRSRTFADSLTQSILAKAFRGELVPTESELAKAEGRSYETAEELLARIQRTTEAGSRSRLVKRDGNGAGSRTQRRSLRHA